MKNTIDIHGFTHEDALPKIQLKIYELLENKHTEIRIITGIGTGVLQNTVENYITNHNKNSDVKLGYSTQNKGGTYIITKIYDDDYDLYYEDEFEETPSQEEIDDIFNKFPKL
ncbi:Smr/MutS family protein [Mycoplasma sp. OR1901]|uniref:Smr/MutS family protein n=1 Tax=Mycoplasma sp. OR1901 TaxID=2742195 RepID=UPI0015842D4C|nr:Smr/MutS family protein [Mycoplasma sp. OR1901]QKT05572.1 Smr/MutS family protein [Mycoplasma sp. OR1901]